MELLTKSYSASSFAVPKNSKNNLSFTGLSTGKIVHLNAIQKITEHNLGRMYDKLLDAVGSDFIQKVNGEDVFKKSNAFVETISYPFTKMWKGWLNSFSEKFNIESLYNKQFLANYRKAGEHEKYERALRGLLQNGDTFLNGAAKGKNIEEILCNSKGKDKCGEFGTICDEVTDNFFKLFDENLAKDRPKYNTTYERTTNKIILGLITASIMGNDFYNKSILNGKSEEEAKKSAKGKRKQELIESGQEALAQYITLGSFSEFTNNHIYAAPVLSTALSTIFRITSRLSKGRPLKRIKLPEKAWIPFKTPTMNEFIQAAKNNESKQYVGESNKLQTNKKKKHILTFKNIGLACLTSIVTGFALKGIKGTKTFENLREYFGKLIPKTIKQGVENFKTGQLWVDEKELNSFYHILDNCELKDMLSYFKDIKLKGIFNNPELVKDGKILLGEYEKMSTIPFTKIQISNKELLQIPLMPFKFLFEIASYPYKAASKILNGICSTKKIAKKLDKLEDTNKVKKVIETLTKETKKPGLENKYNIVNTYLDFQERLQKNGGKVDNKFLEEYEKHLQDNILTALNKETKSNVDNAAIGKLTSLFGLFASLYFSMTDDFNETAKQTGDKEKAEKDARLRGLNKFIRTSVQCVFLSLNQLFKVSYKSSLLGAGLITAACTLLTDSTSRILSGMPFKKMNKEELEKYNKDKKEGILKGYYELLDKLTD